ncbi:radical SAM/SPASM domain Clo7bot peptide maturase [Gorillibacterium sp. CAU 1737]|uniref:radical SAM/SPASM domain Clo7bot peptide maturase n=1 Tax=Gorillibacterium sp. CAU 1737 TaxID=3140362 RepID=UPI00325FE70E
MKVSRYNMFWTLEDGTKLAFNSMTCALAEVNEDFLSMLDRAPELDYEGLAGEEKDLVDQMLLGNYILKDSFDELKVIKYRHFAGKFNSDSLGLTIAPTLSCNFGCPYCYENPKNGMMSREVQDALVELVSDAAKQRKEISITWYGGEPLLAKGIIADMSERMIRVCEENGASYGAFIVTNGYLLDDETIAQFKELRINGAQITLDGPARIHNTRRMLKTSDKGTFDAILANTRKLKENGIQNISIRINVDKTNVDYIEELLDILIDNDLKDVGIGLGHVNAYTDACTSVADACMNTEEYARKNVKYQDILHRKGFSAGGYPYYPGIKANYCCADSTSSFVVDPEGFMYKCWNDVGSVEKAVGQVLRRNEAPDEDMYMRNVDYIFWSPFDYAECVECSLLPVCMGGCPYNGARNGSKPECEKWKYNLEDVLKLTYLQKKDSPEPVCVGDACGCE